MDYSGRIATLADIIMDAAQTLLDPKSSSAQGRSAVRTRAHAKLTQALTAIVSMTQATEAYAVAIEEATLEDDAAGEVASDSAKNPPPAENFAGTTLGGSPALAGMTGPVHEPNYAKYT